MSSSRHYVIAVFLATSREHSKWDYPRSPIAALGDLATLRMWAPAVTAVERSLRVYSTAEHTLHRYQRLGTAFGTSNV